jgi:hypothetical protein
VILYLYALADALEGVDGLIGIAGERVEILTVHDVRVAAGWIAAPPAVSRDALASQDRVVRALHARARALLPFRFGTAAPDVSAAAASLDVIYPGLAARLARVRQRDQMTVRVLRGGGSRTVATPRQDTAERREGPGARYLRARAAARDLPADLQPIFQTVQSLVCATTFEAGRHADLIGTVYHLIDRGEDAAYRAHVSAAAGEHPAFILRMTGPSPAYAFTGID